MQNIFFFTLSFFLFIACSKTKDEQPITDAIPTPIDIDYPMGNLAIEESFELSTVLGGELQSMALDEASGICVSRSNPYITWSHNDSGGSNHIFAVGAKGENFGTFMIQGAGNRDWEDICIGPGPVDGVNYIYVADIGDNKSQFNSITIYRFPEPDVSDLDTITTQFIPNSQVETIVLKYPEGPRDAETLMIDPFTKDLYIVTKRTARSEVYRASYPQITEGIQILEKLATLPFNWAVAGDISADGKQIAIKVPFEIFIGNDKQIKV